MDWVHLTWTGAFGGIWWTRINIFEILPGWWNISFSRRILLLGISREWTQSSTARVHHCVPIALPLDLTFRSEFVTDLRYIIAGKIQQLRSWLPEFCPYHRACTISRVHQVLCPRRRKSCLVWRVKLTIPCSDELRDSRNSTFMSHISSRCRD